MGFIRDVFDVIADTPQHTYQVLTKRSLRLRRLADRLPWPPNLWIGVSVEDASVSSADRASSPSARCTAV
jgi:protein gp37